MLRLNLSYVVSYVWMGFIIAVLSLVTDHRGLPRTIARANNFATRDNELRRCVVGRAIRATVSSFYLLQLNSGETSGTTNSQLTLVNSHNYVFRKLLSSSRFPFQQRLHLQIENAQLEHTVSYDIFLELTLSLSLCLVSSDY